MNHPSALSAIVVFIIFYIGIPFSIVWFFRAKVIQTIHSISNTLKGHARRKKATLLLRPTNKPILSPDQKYDWETQGTFNPAAIMDDAGRVHILYRAIGSDGVSRIGYDSSLDGIHFTDHLPYPVFTMQSPRSRNPLGPQKRNFVMYPSGGSWGGTEDPRMVRLNGRIYVTFSVFDGWDFVRMAIISIDEKDFLNHKWKWTRPILISPEGKPNKNWVVFPEKIAGKYVILHSIAPEIQIAYVKSLDYFTGFIRSDRPEGPQPGREENWDSLLRGAGPPPLKTDLGWLLLYHAIDKEDPSRYKLGAMILGVNDPTKILYRADEPILSPEMEYENDGKPGIIYASGAVIKDDMLFVYYGGGDKHVCVATAPLSEVLSKLKPVS